VTHRDITNYEETQPGEDIVDALDEVGVEVIKSGSGTPGIGVGKWTQNPGESGYPTFLVVGSYFIDVFIDDPTDVDQIAIRYHYEDDEVASLAETSLSMQWWNGAAWVPCSDSGVNADENYVWVKLRSDTSPGLAQMTGTPFSATVQRIVIPSLSLWGTVILGLSFLALTLCLAGKRRRALILRS
jgi:hypothetical protein